MSVDVSEFTQLASILHQNGDKVLNALSKLSLNAVLLQKLNKEFDSFLESNADQKESFQVTIPTQGNSQVLSDLYFLHDFIQKTIGLKLSNNPRLNLLNCKIDISKFKNIKYLEIKKIPISEITGFKNIQTQLESIICLKSLSNLEDLLLKCGGDNSKGFVWSELTEAVLSYNNIRVIDTSIALAPWLQVLDLSHNQITDVKAIECLPNLKYVNLSFNCLNIVPTFNKSARKKIELLVLKNNYIEDLSGVNDLSRLTELDLSNNWIANWESLNTLLTLSTLQWLSLVGNPISYFSDYRKRIAGYLHISASFSDFYLDKLKLSKKEKAIVGIKLNDGSALLTKSHIEGLSRESSHRHKSVQKDKNIDESNNSLRKSGKARLVVIPNLDDGTYEETPSCTNSLDFLGDSSNEYLITKKRIENTRSTYGIDNWLVQGSSVVQDILGLPPSNVFTSTPYDDLCLNAALNSVKNTVTTVAIIETKSETSADNCDRNNPDSFATCQEGDSASKYYSVETHRGKEDCMQNDKPESVESVPSKEISPDIEEIEEEDEEEEDDIKIDENENLFVVLKESKKYNGDLAQEEMFFTITENELQERETMKGKINTKWCLSSLESCVKLKPNKLQLVFDTVRRDRKERVYVLEEREANILYKRMAEILENRTLSDMNQVVYKCENCGSQFSTEIKSRKSNNSDHCPFCHSKFILQLDEPVFPSSDKKVSESKNSKSSESRFSHIRSSSTGGFFQSFRNHSDTKLLNCSSHSSIGSAASLDEINELPIIQNTNVKKSDSDIEILSNPSQSSIEVIDGPARSTGERRRKRSSEERQDSSVGVSEGSGSATVKNNLTQGLTESSSSGSVTDSICTAYENATVATGSKAEGSSSKDVADDSTAKTEPILQEMLSTLRKSIKKKKEVDSVKYSYSDFTNIDHRIKLYLYTQVFEDPTEEFSFGLRAVVSLKSADNNSSPFPACIVASNENLYILKVINPEHGDDARNFLQKIDSLTFNLNNIASLDLLTWHQGFRLKVKASKSKWKYFLILLMNSSRTKNFLNFLASADAVGLSNTKITGETEQKPYLSLQHLLLSSPSMDDTNVQYFCLFSSCSIRGSTDTRDINYGGILTNSTEILLIGENSNWLHEESNVQPKIEVFQKYKNLVQVYANKSLIILQFIDGVKEAEVWSLQMEGENSVEETLKYIRESWEKTFFVPLQVSPI